MACCSLLRLERLLGVLRTSLGKTTGLGFGRLLHTMILRREVQEESRTRNFFGVTVRFWFLYFFLDLHGQSERKLLLYTLLHFGNNAYKKKRELYAVDSAEEKKKTISLTGSQLKKSIDRDDRVPTEF